MTAAPPSKLCPREPTPMLPCPFCGVLPTIQPWHGGPKTKRMIACDSDGCYVAPCVTGPTECEAIERWNIRAAPQPPAPTPAAHRNTITESQAADLETLCKDNAIPVPALLHAAKVDALTAILADNHARALKWIDAAIAKRTAA